MNAAVAEPREEQLPRYFVRKGTQDMMCFQEVIGRNLYHLPERFEEGTVVIDAGGNIGTFTLACLMRGAKHVIAIEPCENNLVQFTKNVPEYAESGSRVTLMRGGLGVGKDNGGPEKLSYIDKGPAHTACGLAMDFDEEALKESGIKPAYQVSCVSLEDVIMEAQKHEPRLLVLKLDIEGAEYDVVYGTCPSALQLCDVILGETHNPSQEYERQTMLDGRQWPMNHAGLLLYLAELGFRVRVRNCHCDPPLANMEFWATTKFGGGSTAARKMFPDHPPPRPGP